MTKHEISQFFFSKNITNSALGIKITIYTNTNTSRVSPNNWSLQIEDVLIDFAPMLT